MTREKKTTTQRKFREHDHGPLAIDPKAFGLFFDASPDSQAEDTDGIAILRICGPLEHHRSWWFQSYDEILTCAKAALEDETTRALVLRIDSPGGEASGMLETAKKIRALGAKHGKPIVAFADECAASAAYGLACAAEEIWLPPSGRVGSVGVIAEVVDATKQYADRGLKIELLTTGARKGDGHPAKPFDDDARSALQAQVDTLGDLFFDLVADARGLAPKRVAALEAGVFVGNDALDKGLADAVGSFDDCLTTVRMALGLAQSAEIGSTPPHKAQGGTPKGSATMTTRLQALAQVEETKKAVLAAKDEKSREKALEAYGAALEAASKYKKKTTVEEEETDDEAEEAEESEESEEAEESEEEEEEEESTGGGSTTGSTQDSTSAEEEGKKMLGSSTGLYTYSRLFRLCHQAARAITGKQKLTVPAVFDAIDRAHRTARLNAKLTARIDKIEDERSSEKAASLLASAKRDAVITRAEGKALEGKDLREVRAYLAIAKTRPKMRTLDDGEIPPSTDPNAPNAALFGRSTAARDIIKRSAARLGKTEDEVARELDAEMQKKPNGAAQPSRY